MPSDTRNRPVIFGEVLFDRFPDNSSVLGGAPFNVAWHLQAFDQSPLFVSAVGNDELGHAIEQAMDDWGMDRSGLQKESKHSTGTVEVQIVNDEPSYDIVNQRAYDFINGDEIPAVTPTLLYHGTLALRHSVSNAALLRLKEKQPPVFLDVNLRPPWWNIETVTALLKDATWVKLNEDELDALSSGTRSTENKARNLLATFNLELLIVTHGKQGAETYDTQGSITTVQPEPCGSMVDTVGAGDAFTSVMITGLLKKWPLETTMQRAQAFASAIVGIRGATTQDMGFYQNFISRWELTD